jgi:hypothetical protein
LSDFRAATPRELKALRALNAVQRQLRRLVLRMTIKRARIRVARTLKAARSMDTITDIRWHAGITTREAEALHALARGLMAQRVFTKARARIEAAVDRP